MDFVFHFLEYFVQNCREDLISFVELSSHHVLGDGGYEAVPRPYPQKQRLMAFDYAVMEVGVAALLGNWATILEKYR